MAWAVWFTGLPGSGKTTVARATEKALAERGIRARVLELDEIRRVLTPEPKYTEEERAIVYAGLAYMAKLLTDEGVNVIIDATGNLRRYRDKAYVLIGNFGEVYISCPLEISHGPGSGPQGPVRPAGHLPERQNGKERDRAWPERALRAAAKAAGDHRLRDLAGGRRKRGS